MECGDIKMATVFFSYTHADEALRNELEIHLSLLKRQGLIEAWHDRRIVAGSHIDNVISGELERADVILLLVSASFIASDYCYSTEMERALERHASGDAQVIPVILRACDWHGAPFGKLLATPTDGKPVTSWPNQDEAFTDVAKSIRKAVTAAPRAATGANPSMVTLGGSAQATVPAHEPLPRSSNLRLKKEFSDFDRDAFLTNGFDFIARFFQGTLQALEERNEDFKTRFERIDSRTFTASIYKSGKAVTQCTVSIGSYGRGSSEIRYADSVSSNANGFNEALTVKEDTQKLFFKPMMSMMSGSAQDQLSEQGAAEYYWSRLIERLQS